MVGKRVRISYEKRSAMNIDEAALMHWRFHARDARWEDRAVDAADKLDLGSKGSGCFAACQSFVVTEVLTFNDEFQVAVSSVADVAKLVPTGMRRR